MRLAFPRPFASIPVCSQAGGCLAVFSSGRAERSGRVEGKIKETGTPMARFLKLLLSAHWLGEPRAAPWFWTPRAAMSGKALALLGFDRHSSPKSGGYLRFGPEVHP